MKSEMRARGEGEERDRRGVRHTDRPICLRDGDIRRTSVNEGTTIPVGLCCVVYSH